MPRRRNSIIYLKDYRTIQTKNTDDIQSQKTRKTYATLKEKGLLLMVLFAGSLSFHVFNKNLFKIIEEGAFMLNWT